MVLSLCCSPAGDTQHSHSGEDEHHSPETLKSQVIKGFSSISCQLHYRLELITVSYKFCVNNLVCLHTQPSSWPPLSVYPCSGIRGLFESQRVLVAVQQLLRQRQTDSNSSFICLNLQSTLTTMIVLYRIMIRIMIIHASQLLQQLLKRDSRW